MDLAAPANILERAYVPMQGNVPSLVKQVLYPCGDPSYGLPSIESQGTSYLSGMSPMSIRSRGFYKERLVLRLDLWLAIKPRAHAVTSSRTCHLNLAFLVSTLLPVGFDDDDILPWASLLL